MSIRAEIRNAIISAPGGQITIDDMFRACPSASDEKNFRSNVAGLKGEGKIKSLHMAPSGKVLYGIDNWPEDTLRQPGAARDRRDRAEKLNAKDSSEAKFGISDAGIIEIKKGSATVFLEPQEIKRLQTFLFSTTEIYEPTPVKPERKKRSRKK